MTERPIIFSGPMVRAILAGRKTQTRRLATSPLAKVQPGDWLWVRETCWLAMRYLRGCYPSGEAFEDPPPSALPDSTPVHYAADGNPPNTPNSTYPNGFREGSGYFAAPDPYALWRKTPSIHAPRWASRITLEVTAVRRQRLQAITPADAEAEGLRKLSKDGGRLWKYGVPGPGEEGWPAGGGEDGMMWQDWKVDPREAFAHLWNSLHTKPGTTWADNPEVVALTFRRLP